MKKKSNVYVLGLGITHNSTVCLLKNGKVVAAVSEERFTRIKNYTGFPHNALEWVLKYEGIGLDEVDLIAHGYTMYGLRAKEWNGRYQVELGPWDNVMGKLSFRIPPIYKFARKAYVKLFTAIRKRNTYRILRQHLDTISRIYLFDHHLCHASAAYYGFVAKAQPMLVFTHDGEGDNLCGSVSIGERHSLTRIGVTRAGNSLAALYGAVTKLLGMKILEDEHKVMGLAPYASHKTLADALAVLSPLIQVNGLEFKAKYDFRGCYEYLKTNLIGKRFDGVAGAVQLMCERLCKKWIRNAIAMTGIRSVALGGGLFLNVKINKAIADLEEVEEVIPTPGGGDESVAIGAAYEGYRLLCELRGQKFEPYPIENLYLGPECSEDCLEHEIKIWSSRKPSWRVERYDEIEDVVANLLAKGEIVARFSGRMEWGPRALGNRSILANPSDWRMVRLINEQIKSRDFWMPFAPTILYERANDYLVNPKQIKSPFMVLAFDTTKLAQKELVAAIHPYDMSARPQVLERDANPSYYDLIKEFEKLTGIGAILNTSFNLHGEPIVCTPSDALDTFNRSGLKYLAIGSFLVVKQ